MQVYDLVISGKRIWKIVGIHLEPVGRQDMVRLVPVTQEPGWAEDNSSGELWVPIELVENNIWSKVK